MDGASGSSRQPGEEIAHLVGKKLVVGQVPEGQPQDHRLQGEANCVRHGGGTPLRPTQLRAVVGIDRRYTEADELQLGEDAT